MQRSLTGNVYVEIIFICKITVLHNINFLLCIHLGKLFQGFNIAMYGLNGGRINIGEQQKVTYAILFLDVVFCKIDSNFLVHNNAGWPCIRGLIF